MSGFTGCSIQSPSGDIPADQPVTITLEVTLVNNSLVCNCVEFQVLVGGVVVNEVTVEVLIGGGANPTTVTVNTPLGAPIEEPSLPDGGDYTIEAEIISDEPGCGLLACNETVQSGSATATEGGKQLDDPVPEAVDFITCGTRTVLPPDTGNGGNGGNGGGDGGDGDGSFFEEHRQELLIGGAALGLTGIGVALSGRE